MVFPQLQEADGFAGSLSGQFEKFLASRRGVDPIHKGDELAWGTVRKREEKIKARGERKGTGIDGRVEEGRRDRGGAWRSETYIQIGNGGGVFFFKQAQHSVVQSGAGYNDVCVRHNGFREMSDLFFFFLECELTAAVWGNSAVLEKTRMGERCVSGGKDKRTDAQMTNYFPDDQRSLNGRKEAVVVWGGVESRLYHPF